VDKETARKNITLGLILALFAAFLFLASFAMAAVIVHG
jgi:hypothetical protein